METGTDQKYGARPLRRKMQDEIEDLLAEEIISGKISRGDKVTVSTKNKKIVVNVAGKNDATII